MPLYWGFFMSGVYQDPCNAF